MENTENGRMVSVEGVDGSGKTTIAKMIANSGMGVYTQEPTHTHTGDLLREALQQDTPKHYDLFLFIADRIQHLERNILPMLEHGDTIICDRFSDSTIAYQSVGCSRSEREFIKHVTRYTDVEPDLTLLLDVDVDTALGRCDVADKHEKREFLEDVRENYLQLAEEHNRIKVIDANQEQYKVFADCVTTIGEYNGNI